METSKSNSLIKSTMNYGAILGIVIVIYSLILWMFDLTTKPLFSYISYGIMIAGIVMATKAYRDTERNGIISYSQALGVGTLTSAFSGVITSFYTYILYTVIDTGLIDKTYLKMEEAYYEAGMSYEQIDAAMEIATKFTNPVMMTIMGLFSAVFIGFIFSLITSIFLKKEGNPFMSDND